jgi:hypothetical protein
MPRIVLSRERAIVNLEELFQKNTILQCSELYRTIYNCNLGRNIKRDKALEVVIKKLLNSGQNALSRLGEERYHPVFLINTKGSFIWFNEVAKQVFHEFTLDIMGDVRDFYSGGTIFTNEQPPKIIDFFGVLFEASKARRRGNGSLRQIAFSEGNDFVFFKSRPSIRISNPVAARLLISTLHNVQFKRRGIGTIGLMSVPNFLKLRRTEDLPNVFIAMPFSEKWNYDVYLEVENAIIGAGYCPVRVDYKQNRDDILKEILRSIQECKLIIADVTGNNANVLFELGYALALHKPFIAINQYVKKSAFDIKHLRQESYSLNKLTKLKMHIFEKLNEGGHRLNTSSDNAD